jgi:hypothetical protein
MRGVIYCNEWKTEKRHEFTNMAKLKRLELWWQLHVTWLPERDVRNIRPIDFCLSVGDLFVSSQTDHQQTRIRNTYRWQTCGHILRNNTNSSRWFAFVDFVLLSSMWPHVYVICVCLVFLSVGDLLVNCHKQITNRQEHQTHTDDIHMRPHTA